MRSVRTALQVLEAVSDLQPVGLTELSRKMGLPKTTVHRGLTSLADAGWLENDPVDPTRWIVGMRAFTVGSTVGNRGGLRTRALPFMNELAAQVQETVHLMVAEADSVVLVERIDSPHPVRAFAALGARAPLHASSNGKAILAHLPADDVAAYVRHGLTAVTEHTITDVAQLDSQLKRIRDQGYAVADEELQAGVTSVAAPVLSPEGRPVASLSISAPSSRMPKRLHRSYGEQVRAAAQGISASLSGRG
ncbi:IclR family transcriptional regulator [Mycolicibacterium sp. CBM1]